jgi:pyruvate/2-oxoglutarate dehydrogenase complex dihydrolipoamide dehydrogenase (E3) component
VEVQLREGGLETISAKVFLLATGSVISDVPLPALREAGYWTSDDVLDTAEVPASVIVLGGGATAVELATYYAGLGRKVTMIQRGKQMLKGTDEDVAGALLEGLRARGVEVALGTKLLDARKDGTERVVIYEQDGARKEARGERIIHALGRSPKIDGLGLDAAQVRVEDGRPATGRTQQTSQAHILAAGDVAGPYEIVHLAIQQAEVATRNAVRLVAQAGSEMEETDYRLRLYVIFCDPEVAVCGRSERELKEAGIAFRAAKYPFNDHGKSMCIGETDGFVKLLAHRESGELLGGAVVGPHAAELIHEIVVAMRFRATAKQLAETPHYHPTLSEIWTYPAEELAE